MSQPLEQFFLTEGQNNFGNKISFVLYGELIMKDKTWIVDDLFQGSHELWITCMYDKQTDQALDINTIFHLHSVCSALAVVRKLLGQDEVGRWTKMIILDHV